ncbi:MAG: glycosyltransferase family 2 protein [Lachnospiraceae bacterium]|nr:glycosyltransferase family 2 protein [Lachnospiraceae bacterium]
MKLLSVAVPCYNSEAYMENCISSLLVGGEEVEILIVDDGSTDRTAEIADRLESEHPGIVRAIHQPNKGHGGAVNTGLENAGGLYFKVVDSDDKVRASAYKSILDVLRRFSGAQTEEAAGDREEALDLLVSNFVYNKEDQNRHRVMEYRGTLPQNRVFSWEEAGRFPVGKYILMHSVIFRTQMLRECGLRLPEHTFYVDNIYVFNPLPYVDRIYYLDVNFYYYYIGREDQSVHESVMIKRLDQQERVNRIMIDYYTDPANRDRIGRSRRLSQYMFNYLEIITTITSVLAIRSGSEDHLRMRDEIWEYLRSRDEDLWQKMRRRPLGIAMNTRKPLAMKLVSGLYLIAQRMFNFN